MNSGINQLFGDENDQLTQIELKDGTRVDADVLIVGIGMRNKNIF